MHIDLNAFFATAEEARNPSLRGKPIVVGHPGRRGVVSTANYEARKYGVHSAMPTYEAVNKCPSLIVVPCDFSYYEMLSNSFFAFLRRISPLVEPASIDEGYVDMTSVLKNEKNPLLYLQKLQKSIYDELDLKCSIGIAPSKFLAKMSSDLKKPMGITVCRRKDMETLIYPLPISSFWGIGKKTAPKLEALGIATIGDFKKRCDENDPAVAELLGKFFFTAKEWVNGYGDDTVNPEPFDPKSIGRMETFSSDTNDYEEISYKIQELAREVATAAQREGKKGKTVSLVVKDTSFKSHDKSSTSKSATNDFEDIYAKALSLYEHNFLGQVIRLVGVSLSSLIDPKEETVQLSFWNYEEYEEMDKTKLLINDFNRKLKGEYLSTLREKKEHGNKKS